MSQTHDITTGPRLMRLKKSPWMRELCSEVGFNRHHLIQPLFAVENLQQDEFIPGLGETHRQNLSSVLHQIERDLKEGVRQFILFGIPKSKGLRGFTGQYTAQVIAEIKKRFAGELDLWVDTCLCSYTEHGHCCVLHSNKDAIDLSTTLNELSNLALEYASAGASGISPSDMMDGRVAHIRNRLDASGFQDVPIMSYSTKFASQFYGPFRVAADSAPSFGDRKGYQLDVRNASEALRASLRCAEEGADLLMVKPAMTSLDLIGKIHEATLLPTGAYQVSGEYAALLALEAQGLIDFEKALVESWQVLRRSGAQFIITYGARYGKKLGF